MYKLLLKKSFFDGWDHILILFLTNIVFAAAILLILYTDSFFLVPVILLFFSFHLLGMSGAAYNMTGDVGKWYEGYVKAIRKAGHFFVFYFVLLLVFLMLGYAAPLYLSTGDFFLYTIGFFLLFAGLVILIALMYYYPLCMMLENDKPFTILKKCFIVLFDNFGFSIYCLMKNICDMAVSVLTMFLMPGIVGVTITQTNALRFIMLRYDWMEEKKVGKHNVSADMYLAPVFEQYRERNLRTLFFPWKKD